VDNPFHDVCGRWQLIRLAGDNYKPKSLVRIRSTGMPETLATWIDNIPLGVSEAVIASTRGSLYIVTDQTCNLFFIDLEGQGRLISNLTSLDGTCSPITMTATWNGEIFYLGHGAYILYRISARGDAKPYAYGMIGDSWAMVVDPDGNWLYVAEAGAIDKIPI
jgi:hypothetical protein